MTENIVIAMLKDNLESEICNPDIRNDYEVITTVSRSPICFL